MTTNVMLGHDDIVSIVQEVWASFLGDESMAALELVGTDRTGVNAGTAGMTGSVSVTGAWSGTVLLSCPARLAGLAAAAMFMADVDVLTEDEICDALGELTNMVGGTIKATMPGPSVLSIPTVASGTEFHVHIPGASCIGEVVLAWRGDLFTVSIWEG